MWVEVHPMDVLYRSLCRILFRSFVRWYPMLGTSPGGILVQISSCFSACFGIRTWIIKNENRMGKRLSPRRTCIGHCLVGSIPDQLGRHDIRRYNRLVAIINALPSEDSKVKRDNQALVSDRGKVNAKQHAPPLRGGCVSQKLP